jgi:uncharacterized damage-inducible protein DinB
VASQGSHGNVIRDRGVERGGMISVQYVRTMSRYNQVMNRRFFAAAERLPDAQRRADRGAFWMSIHETLSHLLWADRMWMARFAGWAKPSRPLHESHLEYADYANMATHRAATDVDMVTWADTLTDHWLAQDLTWFSAAAARELSRPRAELVMHLINHQTHHRGQVHAMLTAAGQQTGDTDLWLVLEADEP